MTDIRLIALDLDGTLLNSEKRLSPGNLAALTEAAARGIEIVPTTGRFFLGMPEEVRALPFLHYAIISNGAQVLDTQTGAVLYDAPIPLAQALEVMDYLHTLPVLYDCYQDGGAYVTAAFLDRAEDYIDYPPSLEMMRRLRKGVPELRAFLRERGRGVQKMQLFTRDRGLREELLRSLAARWPALMFTASVPNNIEINAAQATKGFAMLSLAFHLGLAQEQTAAFGDGRNDISMLRAAGLSIAMGNAHPQAKDAARYVTGDCDADGVAEGIRKWILPE